MAMTKFTYGSPVVKWPAAKCSFGELEYFLLTIPPTVSGRLDIWKVPVDPDTDNHGYWVNVWTGGNEGGFEPGCYDWEKTLLVQIRLAGHDEAVETYDPDEDQMRDHQGQQNVVEYINQEFFQKIGGLDTSALNPKAQEEAV